MTADESIGRNRREHFRLDDTATLRVRIVDGDSLEDIETGFNDYRLRHCMKSRIQNQMELRRPRLIRIKKSSSDVAEYLDSLEHLITEIAQRLDEVSNATLEGYEFTGKVNISATGVRFNSDQRLESGQILEIGMTLGASRTQIVVLGEVTRFEEHEGSEYSVSVHYTHIHPEDEETLIHHLAQLQRMELQSRRDSREQE